MKVLRVLLLALAALAGLLAVVSLLLPARLQVERSIEIGAAPERVYGYVVDLGRFHEWSPWAGLDPDTQYVLSGPAGQPGARLEWRSKLPKVGSGSQEIVAAKPPREVGVRLVFDDQGEAIWTLRLEELRSGARVIWRLDMDLGLNPVKRWTGLIVAGSVGTDYARGLDRLKALVETEAAAEAEAAARAGAADALDAGTESVPQPLVF